MRFEGHGVLFVHLLDPSLDFASKSALLSEAVEQTRKPAEQELSHREVLGDARVLAVAGECDLLLRLDLTDFRAVPVLQRHLFGAGVQSAAWVLSIPYDLPTVARDATVPAGCENPATRPLHFVTHIRLRRAVYRVAGGEDAVLKRIAGLLRDSPGVSAAIHSALGWFDVLISGTFTVAPQKFAKLLAQLSSLRFADIPGKVALQKMLTLLAYEPGAGTAQLITHPLIVARTASAGYTGAVTHLAQQFRSLDPVFFHVDGTRDFLLLPGAGARPQKLEELLVALSPRGREIRNAGVERLETHLLVMRPEELEQIGNPAAEEAEFGDQLQRCSCSKVALAYEHLGHRVGKLPVPKALQQTVLNVLMLHSYSLNDEATCCDVRPALTACAAALDRLVTRIEGIQRLHEEDARRATYWFEALNKRRELLDIWCSSAEAILSERVAGGFQEFFEVNDRIVAYRGGVQKLLFITDHLLSAFLSEIDPPSSAALDTSVPLFATLHEPISAIRSESALGVVKLPLRYRFSLPTVLPQLWHEVGQFVFHHRYPVPVDPNTEERLSELDGLLKGQINDLERARAALQAKLHNKELSKGSRLRIARALSQREDQLAELVAYANQTPETMVVLSDLYADLIVFVFGFRGRFPDFAHYLTTLYFDLARAERQEGEMWERACDVLLIRLYFVSRLALLWQAGEEPQTDGWRRLRIDQLVEFVHDVASRRPYKDRLLPLPEELVKRIYHIVRKSDVFKVFYEHYLQDFYAEYVKRGREITPADWKIDKSTWKRLEKGEVVDFDVPQQINACYELLYTRQLKERLGIQPRRRAPIWFREIAALGKSALLTFYRQSS